MKKRAFMINETAEKILNIIREEHARKAENYRGSAGEA